MCGSREDKIGKPRLLDTAEPLERPRSDDSSHSVFEFVSLELDQVVNRVADALWAKFTIHGSVELPKPVTTSTRAMTHHRSYQIPLHRRKPVPTAKVDPGLRRESAEGTSSCIN